MGDCFAEHHIEGVGLPFSGGTTASIGAAPTASATQPFGGSLPETPIPRVVPPPSVATAQPQSTPAVPKTETASCKDDWKRCADNDDLVNNYSEYYEVQSDCERAANKQAKYGTPIWPGFWSGGSFNTFHKGSDYVKTGIVVAIEKDVQFSNEFGAMVHSTAYCKYDLNTNAVISVDIAPKY
jgi:hypothetical protein